MDEIEDDILKSAVTFIGEGPNSKLSTPYKKVTYKGVTFLIYRITVADFCLPA